MAPQRHNSFVGMMTKPSRELTQKIEEVCEELKRTALWKSDVPEWVWRYREMPESKVEFGEWLQFVFLPNKLKGNRDFFPGSIAPQAVRFFGSDVHKGRLLQLLVELDSLD